jgi:hypothetical protein
MNPAAAEMPHSYVVEAESVSIGTLAETLLGPDFWPSRPQCACWTSAPAATLRRTRIAVRRSAPRQVVSAAPEPRQQPRSRTEVPAVGSMSCSGLRHRLGGLVGAGASVGDVRDAADLHHEVRRDGTRPASCCACDTASHSIAWKATAGCPRTAAIGLTVDARKSWGSWRPRAAERECAQNRPAAAHNLSCVRVLVQSPVFLPRHDAPH